MQVLRNLDDLTINLCLKLCDERGYFFKVKYYNYSLELQVQEEKALGLLAKYMVIISNCRSLLSSYVTNSLVEFDRREVHVAVHTLLGVPT